MFDVVFEDGRNMSATVFNLVFHNILSIFVIIDFSFINTGFTGQRGFPGKPGFSGPKGRPGLPGLDGFPGGRVCV